MPLPFIQVVLLLALMFSVVGGFFLLVFRQAAKLTKHLPSSSGLAEDLMQAQREYEKGHYQQAADLWRKLILHFERSGSIAGILSAATMTGRCYERLGRYDEALQAYSSATNVRYGEEHEEILIMAHRRGGYCHLKLGDPVAAEASFAKVAEMQRRSGKLKECIETRISFGNTLRREGYLEEAAAVYEEALELSRQMEQENGRRSTLHDQAMFLCSMGQTSKALDCAREAVQISLRAADTAVQSHMSSSLAMILRVLGHAEEAAAFSLRAIELAKAARSARCLCIAAHVGSRVAWLRGNRDEAWDLIGQAEEAIDSGALDRRPRIAITRANYSVESSDFDAALEALTSTEKSGPALTRHVEAAMLNVRARAFAGSGQVENAAAAVGKLREVTGKLRAPAYVADCAMTEGIVANARDNCGDALDHFRRALEFFEAAGFKREVALVQMYRASALSAIADETNAVFAREVARRIFLELGDKATVEDIAFRQWRD